MILMVLKNSCLISLSGLNIVVVELYRNCTEPGNGTSECDIKKVLVENAKSVSTGVGLFGVVCCIAVYTHTFLFTIVADRITRRVRRLAFSNILRQNIGYFDIHFGGELNTRLTQSVI